MKNCNIAKLSGLVVFCLIVVSSNAYSRDPLKLVGGFFGVGKAAVEADPNKEYGIDETNGPWMIYVKSYSGEFAKQDAHTLALELRKKYKMKAYVHHKTFDHAKELEKDIQTTPVSFTGQSGEPIRIPRKKLLSGNKAVNEYAVMVGDFQSINDNDINAAFAAIKSAQPDCIVAQIERDAKNANDEEVDKAFIELVRMNVREKYQTGYSPFGWAFKCTNPILPHEYFDEQGKFVDDFVVSLNSQTSFSLLRCQAKYTIQIADFSGKVFLSPTEVSKIEHGEMNMHDGDKLEKAADHAEKLCHALRQKGWEAYSFHDRSKSIVTVGGFNELGRTDKEGVTHLSKEIEKIYFAFQADPSAVDPNKVQPGSMIVKRIMGVDLMPQPIPIEVPKMRPKVAGR